MRLKPEDKVTFYEGLNRLLGSGIPIDESLEGLMDDYNKGLKVFLDDLRNELIRGVTMSSVLIKYPEIFSPVEVSLIKAGEESGNLEEILDNLAANVKEEILFKNKVISALTYPIFLVFVFVFIFFAIILYVVPKFKGVFAKLKVEIPIPTQILFALSDMVINGWPIILGISLLLIVLTVVFYKLNKPFIVSLFASLPVAKGVYSNLDIYKFSKTMSLLSASGVPIVKALTLSREVLYKKQMKKLISESIDNVTSGEKLSLSFKAYPRLFPPALTKIIQYGEVSGSMEKSFRDIASIADTKVRNSLDRIGVLLEPIMVFSVGITIGLFMIALIYPMYQMIGNINNF